MYTFCEKGKNGHVLKYGITTKVQKMKLPDEKITSYVNGIPCTCIWMNEHAFIHTVNGKVYVCVIGQNKMVEMETDIDWKFDISHLNGEPFLGHNDVLLFEGDDYYAIKVIDHLGEHCIVYVNEIEYHYKVK